MNDQQRIYMAIDLKSFYASVECIAHHLNPLNANLVVADRSRTNKTICLAVSPALKQFGVPGRPRLYEVQQIVDRLNRERAKKATCHHLSKHDSIYRGKLLKSPNLRIGFQIVPPRMHFYMEKSAEVYGIYLRFIKPENIHTYSIDEVMMDVTDYLHDHQVSPHTLAKQIIQQIQLETGITATAGIGTNLYLAKVAMDIVAKRIPADQDGVRIAQMNEYQYRRYLWAHQPLTDFWRIGRGYAKRLEKLGLHTMGDIARCSLGKLSDPFNEEILYREFGKNAELLIDHAWGHEMATIADIKNYHSEEHGIYSSQVLMKPYKYHEGLATAQGMVDSVALSMVKRHVVSADFGIVINYDPQSLQYAPNYQGPVVEDFYGRRTAKPSHAHKKLDLPTAAGSELRQIYKELYKKCTNPSLLIRKITLIVTHMIDEDVAAQTPYFKQVNLFEDPQREIKQEQAAAIKRQRDQKLQATILKLQQKLGNKNVILHLADLKKGSTTKERNDQIGGHQA